MSSKKMKKLPASPPWSDFPSDVLKWMKKNAKPKAALKLMQICKYFQHQEFPFFVVKELILGNRWRYRTLPGYPLKPKNYVTGKFCDQPFDVWVAESLSLAMSSWSKVLYDDCWGQMLPKLAVHDVKCLSFDHVSITFREFKVLNDGGKVSSLNLKSAFIRDESHEIVPLENLFECLPNLKDLEM
uniref:Uncharacterized protein n=1 Tax=Panagrolaimus davidi TaxID=227884 RepID=A0A914Q9Z7_9BILA